VRAETVFAGGLAGKGGDDEKGWGGHGLIAEGVWGECDSS
jgi:hypothetical protein